MGGVFAHIVHSLLPEAFFVPTSTLDKEEYLCYYIKSESGQRAQKEIRMRYTLLVSLAIMGCAAPAVAQEVPVTTVTVAADAPEGIVYKTLNGEDAIQARSLRGQIGVSCGVSACMNTFQRNPEFLRGAEICISNTGNEWALEPDGTQSRDPRRAPACAVIRADGTFSITGRFRINATPYIRKDGLFAGWVDRKSLRGMPDFVSFE